MFENQFFDQWLDQKSKEILTKLDKEKITTEEMLILSLKAQTNHFHHMDIEFRDEFKSIDRRFDLIDKRFENIDKRFENIDKRFENIDKRFENIDKNFDNIDKKFESFDKKFERLMNLTTWGIGLILTVLLTLKILGS